MLLYCATLLSRLPLKVHYGFADWLLFPLMYYVVRYRRKIVDKNLCIAFPDKTDSERARIARDFYHQFCDTLVEIIYGFGCPDEEMMQRTGFEGMEEANRLFDEAGGGIVMMAHLGNWEWLFTTPQCLSPGMTQLTVYRRLKNKAVEKLMQTVRGKRGTVCVEKKQTFRIAEQYSLTRRPFVFFLASDQKPRPDARQERLIFLHRETGFFTGGETLGKKYGFPVIYLHVNRVQRGYYKVKVQLITTDPRSTAEGEITRTYARLLEENIQEQPELWLWSHNRFKTAKKNKE